MTLPNGQPAIGVTLTIGGYSVVTDSSGHYAFGYLARREYVVTVIPRDKRPKSFPVSVTDNPTHRDFVIDW